MVPGPNVQTDDEILAYARQTVITVFHQSGTCKMGQDPMAVVDERLRVHGMDGPAGGRRLDHAERHFRQHQCADDDDRAKRPPR